MLKNSEIRAFAWNALKPKWQNPVLITLIFSLISGVAGALPFLSPIVSIFVLLPLEFSFVLLMRQFIITDGQIEIRDLFNCFKKESYWRIVSVALLTVVYTLLWMLLLIIPGIIKAYSYAMTYYIANENPELSSEECINKSMEMMQGKKGKLFLLDLSFFGWAILCIFTFGIGYLWLIPYIQTSRAKFYEELKAEYSL